MGGFMTISKRTGRQVWSCMKCAWIHKPEIAQMILEELRKIIDKVTPYDLQVLRFKVWMEAAKCDV